MARINAERLLRRLAEVSEIGKYRTGIHRPTYSDDDMTARRWLVRELGDIGHQAFIDGVGNVVGRSRASRQRLLMGSHIESQNQAGRLDGVLGVLYGLEIATAFSEAYGSENVPVDVMAFADEEGHYLDYLGVRSAIGDLPPEELAEVANVHNGRPLAEALSHAGIAGVARHRIRPEDYIGYLEGHIEQGDYLDSGGLRLGYVTGIVGTWQYNMVVVGKQNHAGTTRMETRRDAVTSLIKFGYDLDGAIALSAGPKSVWTPARIITDPGAPSVVAGRAEMYFQFRDGDFTTMKRMEAALQDVVDRHNRQGPCSIEVQVMSKADPIGMEPTFTDCLATAGERHAPGAGMRMPSAAGHDAQYMAKIMPAAMLFVPSIAGVSHHWSENTKDEDIVIGCQVMADAAYDIITQADKAGVGR